MRYSPMLKLSHTSGLRLLGAALVCAGYAALTACTSADSDLARFIEDTKKEPGGRVGRLRALQPSGPAGSAAAALRAPFRPSTPGAGAGYGGIRRDSLRNREFVGRVSGDPLKSLCAVRVGGHAVHQPVLGT